MSNNNNTNNLRGTQTFRNVVLWILNRLKKKKRAAEILGNFRPRKNSLTCHFFIYEAILAIFFVLFVLMRYYCIMYQKYIYVQNRAIRCILILGGVRGVTPLRADYLFFT